MMPSPCQAVDVYSESGLLPGATLPAVISLFTLIIPCNNMQIQRAICHWRIVKGPKLPAILAVCGGQNCRSRAKGKQKDSLFMPDHISIRVYMYVYACVFCPPPPHTHSLAIKVHRLEAAFRTKHNLHQSARVRLLFTCCFLDPLLQK